MNWLSKWKIETIYRKAKRTKNEDNWNSWKKATVIPIPKQGDLSTVANYRPISLLPAHSKVIEKLIHQQFTEHIETYHYLTSYQYGFRKAHSTTHAITQQVNHISDRFNRKATMVALFVDFSKKPDNTKYQKSIAHIGPQLWNSLPGALQKTDNYTEFKIQLKKHLTTDA